MEVVKDRITATSLWRSRSKKEALKPQIRRLIVVSNAGRYKKGL